MTAVPPERNKVYRIVGKRLDEREVIQLIQIALMPMARIKWLDHQRHEGLSYVTIDVEGDEHYLWSFDQFVPVRNVPAFDLNNGNITIAFYHDVGQPVPATPTKRSKKVTT
jgi:hypothetical protein